MLSERLARLIGCLGIKKVEFAAKIGFTQSYISKILGDEKNKPSSRFFDKVCMVFHVNSEWLRGGAGEMFDIPGAGESADDSLLIKYRLLPKPEQKIVEEIVDAMLFRNMNKKDSG